MQKKVRATNPTSRSMTMVGKLKSGQTPAAGLAEMMAKGIAMNAVTAIDFSKTLGDLDLTECVNALKVATETVNAGDLKGLEATLTAQAAALNAMFTQFAHQASKMTNVDQIDRFTRLALKAQGQCRATVETLAQMKSPPMVFARQANVTSGPQQVNNVVGALPAREGNQKTEPNKLLEAHGERLDSGTAGAAVSGNSQLASVGAFNRPKKRGR